MVAEPRNHLSGPTSLKIGITHTQYVLSGSCYPPKLNKTGATLHLISHIRNCITEVLNEKDKGQGDIRDSTIALRPTYCDERFSEALVRLFVSQDLSLLKQCGS